LHCKRALQKRRYSAKETYNFIDSPDRSHPTRDAGLVLWRISAECARIAHAHVYLYAHVGRGSSVAVKHSPVQKLSNTQESEYT